jgi:hypothetical protein
MLVVDASAVTELLLGRSAAEPAAAALRAHDFDLHAPHLVDIDVLSALRRIIAAGDASPSRGADPVTDFLDLPLRSSPTTACRCSPLTPGSRVWRPSTPGSRSSSRPDVRGTGSTRVWRCANASVCCDASPMEDKVDLGEKLALLDPPYQPAIIGYLNDYKLAVVKVHVELGAGELFVVPRGVEPCPRADELARVLLIEPKGTVNTGDAGPELTASERTI